MKTKYLIGVLLFLMKGHLLAFPLSFNNGSAVMKDHRFINKMSVGFVAGVVAHGSMKNQIGFYYADKHAYQSFLGVDHPLTVRPEPAAAASSRWIERPDRTLRLSWSSGVNSLPVNYRIYFGKDPSSLALVATTGDQEHLLNNLEYLVEYYWQIESFDDYGRSTMSPIYSFSIAPMVSKLYCAPNPFRAGFEPTTFLFQMPGPGSADFKVYLLPYLDQAFSVSLNGLQDGVNTYVYDGRDNDGRVLYNGVYLAVVNMKGGVGNVKQNFKFIVAR